MSGPLSVVNGNPPQGLSAAQLEQLNAIASVAKGSGLFEGANGGKGIMGSFVDSVTGQTHYIKMLTHKGERTNALGGNPDETNLLSSKKLGEVSNSLKDDLLKLAKTVGVEDAVKALFDSRKGDFKDLVSRKIAAQAVSLIGKAHNNATGANGVRFNWKTVAHAGTEGNSTLRAVPLMKARECLKDQIGEITKEIGLCEEKIKDARDAKLFGSSRIQNCYRPGGAVEKQTRYDVEIENLTRKHNSLKEGLRELEGCLVRIEYELSEADVPDQDLSFVQKYMDKARAKVMGGGEIFQPTEQGRMQSLTKEAALKLEDLAKDLKANNGDREASKEWVKFLGGRIKELEGEIGSYNGEMAAKTKALKECTKRPEKEKSEEERVDSAKDDVKPTVDLDKLEREIADLNSLIIQRDTALKVAKNDLAKTQQSLEKSNNLPEDINLVKQAKGVIEAFTKGKLSLNASDKGTVPSMIGALAGCNGTTDVRDTLQLFKDTVNTLANTKEVRELLIAAETAERSE